LIAATKAEPGWSLTYPTLLILVWFERIERGYAPDAIRWLNLVIKAVRLGELTRQALTNLHKSGPFDLAQDRR